MTKFPFEKEILIGICIGMALVLMMVLFPQARASEAEQHGATCVAVKQIHYTAYAWTRDVDGFRDRVSDAAVVVKHPAVCERKIGHPTP